MKPYIPEKRENKLLLKSQKTKINLPKKLKQLMPRYIDCTEDLKGFFVFNKKNNFKEFYKGGFKVLLTSDIKNYNSFILPTDGLKRLILPLEGLKRLLRPKMTLKTLNCP